MLGTKGASAGRACEVSADRRAKGREVEGGSGDPSGDSGLPRGDTGEKMSTSAAAVSVHMALLSEHAWLEHAGGLQPCDVAFKHIGPLTLAHWVKGAVAGSLGNRQPGDSKVHAGRPDCLWSLC